MAEEPERQEKTEDPTQKKLDDARKRGDMPKSQEVSSLFVLSGGALLVLISAMGMGRDLAAGLQGFLSHAHEIAADGGNLVAVWHRVALMLIAAILVPMGILMITGLLGHLVQNPPVLTIEPLKPKLSKISPIAGLKRLFSMESLVNFGKSLAKLAIVSAVIFAIVWPRRDQLDLMVSMEAASLLDLIRSLSLTVFAGVIAVFAVIAGLDFLYQRYRWYEKQRMTVKEVRDEHKQTEGDPHVKAKLRQVRMERGRKRMMQNVPDATVVITNPTHYAVALKYEEGMMAPRCVAKGVDAVALRIRAIAMEHDIAIVENPPLARTLHAAVDIDDEIPPDHYKAVAQVIGYVMQLNAKRSWRRASR